MFIKAKSKNGQYKPFTILKGKSDKKSWNSFNICDCVCLYINPSNNLQSLTLLVINSLPLLLTWWRRGEMFPKLSRLYVTNIYIYIYIYIYI